MKNTKKQNLTWAKHETNNVDMMLAKINNYLIGQGRKYVLFMNNFSRSNEAKRPF